MDLQSLPVGQTLKGLFSQVGNDVFTTLTRDILFPPRPDTYIEHLRSKLKGQFAITRSQQSTTIFQAGKIQMMNHEIRNKTNLLTDKDKEIQRLKKYIRSLELQLYNERSRHQRRR